VASCDGIQSCSDAATGATETSSDSVHSDAVSRLETELDYIEQVSDQSLLNLTAHDWHMTQSYHLCANSQYTTYCMLATFSRKRRLHAAIYYLSICWSRLSSSRAVDVRPVMYSQTVSPEGGTDVASVHILARVHEGQVHLVYLLNLLLPIFCFLLIIAYVYVCIVQRTDGCCEKIHWLSACYLPIRIVWCSVFTLMLISTLCMSFFCFISAACHMHVAPMLQA